MQAEVLNVEDFSNLNKGLPRSVSYMLNHPEETSEMEISNSFPAQVRLMSDYRVQIYGLLGETLQWMYHHKHLHPKLEGRYWLIFFSIRNHCFLPKRMHAGLVSSDGLMYHRFFLEVNLIKRALSTSYPQTPTTSVVFDLGENLLLNYSISSS